METVKGNGGRRTKTPQTREEEQEKQVCDFL
jgi:hypothetical protein